MQFRTPHFARRRCVRREMEPRSLKFFAAACAGVMKSDSPRTLVSRVSTDSRQAQPGDLFIALRGERFDGHEFVEDVAKKNVVGVVVERGRTKPAWSLETRCAVIEVDDARQALGKIAGAYRKDFSPAMICVGGSNGKTTTKELVAAVLRQKLDVIWSEASFNNDIGVPMTLLKLDMQTQAAVLEAGTNHPGELAPLVRMIQPRYGVITSIGREHLEFFGDLAGVAEEEGALAELLPNDGKLFLNGDSEWTDKIASRTGARVVRVGLSEKNDWRARNIHMDRNGVEFHVDAPDENFSGDYRIKLFGRHQVNNALFAVAIGAEMKLSREQIQRGLLECNPAKMRMQLLEVAGVSVLDDAYNANADSMLAALETLRDFEGRRIAVLGDMAELGAHAKAAHEEVGRHVAESGADHFFAVGKWANVMAKGAREAGLADVDEFIDVDEAANAVKNFARAGDIILIKASRSTRLERVGDALRNRTSGERT
jgi:UDP-N-acetylmuramoyl-tripeptide--D-alanyl-D-alanine ligase